MDQAQFLQGKKNFASLTRCSFLHTHVLLGTACAVPFLHLCLSVDTPYCLKHDLVAQNDEEASLLKDEENANDPNSIRRISLKNIKLKDLIGSGGFAKV